MTPAQYREAVTAGVAPAGPAGYHIPGLADVDGWARLDLVDAADRVQRSAFPDAVADDIPLARSLVARFTTGPVFGTGADAVLTASSTGCPDSTPVAGVGQCPPTGSPAEERIQPDTLLVLRCVSQQFPKITTFYGFRPHDPFPDHPSGRAVDIMINSAFPDYTSPAAVAYGHRVAEWLEAHHAELGVEYVIYRQHIWNITRDAEGWRPMADRGNPTANHMDHVHVTTYGHAARTAKKTPSDVAVGQAMTPVEHCTISATFGQIGPWARYHTGLDFAAPIGTPVRAALTGVFTHAGPGPAAPWAGNYITIRHPDGTSTLYAHLSMVAVRAGQVLASGQHIGGVGMTGRSFGPHLHLEVYPRGVTPGEVYRATDPAQWLRKDGVNPVA